MAFIPQRLQLRDDVPVRPSSPAPYSPPRPPSRALANFFFVLKMWPVITAATIGLCYLTQHIAKLYGIDLPDQQNVDVVRHILENTFEGDGPFYTLKTFWASAVLLFEIAILMPVVEELVFRGLLFKYPDPQRLWLPAVTSSIFFSAAHYLSQPWPDTAFVALFFFGLAQCWIVEQTRSLSAAMLNHTLFNLTNIALMFLAPQA